MALEMISSTCELWCVSAKKQMERERAGDLEGYRAEMLLNCAFNSFSLRLFHNKVIWILKCTKASISLMHSCHTCCTT